MVKRNAKAISLTRLEIWSHNRSALIFDYRVYFGMSKRVNNIFNNEIRQKQTNKQTRLESREGYWRPHDECWHTRSMARWSHGLVWRTSSTDHFVIGKNDNEIKNSITRTFLQWDKQDLHRRQIRCVLARLLRFFLWSITDENMGEPANRNTRTQNLKNKKTTIKKQDRTWLNETKPGKTNSWSPTAPNEARVRRTYAACDTAHAALRDLYIV